MSVRDLFPFHAPSPTCVSRAAASNAAPFRRPRRAQAPLRLPLLGGRGREGGSPPSSRFSRGTWFPLGQAEDGQLPCVCPAALPCPEERCWRCAAALLPPSFPSPGIAELHILDRRGSRPAALSQPRGHRGLFSQPPCSAVRAQEARPPSRPGSAQAAMSAPRVPAGTPKQSLCREDFLGLSPWKGEGWRALPQRR